MMSVVFENSLQIFLHVSGTEEQNDMQTTKTTDITTEVTKNSYVIII